MIKEKLWKLLNLIEIGYLAKYIITSDTIPSLYKNRDGLKWGYYYDNDTKLYYLCGFDPKAEKYLDKRGYIIR